jgi:membrane-associated phospholipid phosphatase
VRQPSVEWNDAWPKFSPFEYGLTGALIAADIGIVAYVRDPDPRWDGMLPFDGAAGTALRAGSGKARQRAQWWSDRIHETNFFIGLLEAPLAATLYGDGTVAWQTLMINAEAFAAAGLVQLTSARLVGRARPFVQHCKEKGDEDFPCKEGGTTLSFLSGHAMTSFVAAGLTCAHHARLPLYGGGAGDIAACAVMLTSGTLTGALRVVADKHYASDVVLGGILGFAFGFGIPMLFHYRGTETMQSTQTAAVRQVLTFSSAF